MRCEILGPKYVIDFFSKCFYQSFWKVGALIHTVEQCSKTFLKVLKFLWILPAPVGSENVIKILSKYLIKASLACTLSAGWMLKHC